MGVGGGRYMGTLLFLSFSINLKLFKNSLLIKILSIKSTNEKIFLDKNWENPLPTDLPYKKYCGEPQAETTAHQVLIWVHIQKRKLRSSMNSKQDKPVRPILIETLFKPWKPKTKRKILKAAIEKQLMYKELFSQINSQFHISNQEVY